MGLGLPSQQRTRTDGVNETADLLTLPPSLAGVSPGALCGGNRPPNPILLLRPH